MMKKAKKFALLMGAMVLVCIISVVGTLAYLNAKSNTLTNTFVANNGLFTDGPQDGLHLKEHAVQLNTTTGEYTLKTGDANLTSSGVSYKAVPNATLPKDPVLSGVGKTDLPGYVYVEVVDSTNGAITYEMGADWTKLMNGAVEVKHNGNQVYVYKSGAAVTANFSSQILKNNQVKVVNDNAKVEALDANSTLVFNGYCCQCASFTSAAAAFIAVFND